MANSQTVFLISAVYAWPFIHCLYFINERKIFGRTPVKITRQWKSTLTQWNALRCIAKCSTNKGYNELPNNDRQNTSLCQERKAQNTSRRYLLPILFVCVCVFVWRPMKKNRFFCFIFENQINSQCKTSNQRRVDYTTALSTTGGPSSVWEFYH